MDYGPVILMASLFPITKYQKKWVGIAPVILTYFFVVGWHSLWNQSILPETLKHVALPAIVGLILIVANSLYGGLITKRKELSVFVLAASLIVIGALYYVVYEQQDQIILSFAVLFIAILTLFMAIRQTELVRRTLYGEIYGEPPLERVAFLKLKGRQDERVQFDQPISWWGFV